METDHFSWFILLSRPNLHTFRYQGWCVVARSVIDLKRFVNWTAASQGIFRQSFQAGADRYYYAELDVNVFGTQPTLPANRDILLLHPVQYGYDSTHEFRYYIPAKELGVDEQKLLDDADSVVRYYAMPAGVTPNYPPADRVLLNSRHNSDRARTVALVLAARRGLPTPAPAVRDFSKRIVRWKSISKRATEGDPEE